MDALFCRVHAIESEFGTLTMAAKREWASLPRKRCETCGDLYKPYRPDQRFCSVKCRTDFHHHGGAYAKLKPLLLKELRQRTAEIEAKLSRDVDARVERRVLDHLKRAGLA